MAGLSPSRGPWRIAALLGTVLLLLSACASTKQPEFYTLMPGIDLTASARSGGDPVHLRFGNVSVPEAHSRAVIVARAPGASAEGLLVRFPRERWLSSYPVEVRDSLRYQVARLLNARDVTRGRTLPGARVLRIDVQVQALDRVLGQRVAGEFSWTVSGGAKPLRCEARIQHAVQGESASALVQAERRLMEKLAAAVAGSADPAASNVPADCVETSARRARPFRPSAPRTDKRKAT
jgi:uncharacterized lipoprotein YmbA